MYNINIKQLKQSSLFSISIITFAFFSEYLLMPTIFVDVVHMGETLLENGSNDLLFVEILYKLNLNKNHPIITTTKNRPLDGIMNVYLSNRDVFFQSFLWLRFMSYVIYFSDLSF